ncbi:hypothetical protein [Nesterenkonia alba]|uniref:hypothetical protein n=1 Tax=Nesterenkonia alba TaxID=515814 RepID=UPI0003B3B704|nr:hypothetical protein [Nesterenkonia alba]
MSTLDQCRFTRVSLGITAAAIFAVTACSSDEDAEFEDVNSTSETEEQAEGEEIGTTSPSGTPTEANDSGNTQADDNSDDDETHESASEGPLDPADALETVEYEVPGEAGNTVTVGLHDLRVEGEVMLLELSFTGEFSNRDSNNIFMMFGGTAIYPELNDRENLKQYTVIGQGHDRWATDSTNSGHQYESGQTAPYWAYYAAPVDEIDTLTVSVIPGAVEFEDVEIDWDGQTPGGSSDDTDENGTDEDGQ